MGGARESADATQVGDALERARRRAGGRARPLAGRGAMLALQRRAGNAAVSALVAARFRSPGRQAIGEINAALRELRRDEPVIDTVEKGLKAAKAVGVPVDLEGPKPPASALAVTVTGFGPGSVAAKKPPAPPKKVPARSPLGKAAAALAKVKQAPQRPAVEPAPPAPAAATASTVPAPPVAELRLQPPVPPAPVRPDDDPAFAQVKRNVTRAAKAKRAHPPAASKAKEAQGAALPPANDRGGQAKAAKVDTMDAQQAGSFDKKAFIAAVKAAIEAKSPRTLKEADNYKKSGKAGEVKGEVKGLVTQGKEGQVKDIATATEAAPDESKAVPKPVTPMAPEQPGPPPAVGAAGAAPKPAPPEQLNLEAGKHQVNAEMAEAEVSDSQLAQSNEPEFQQALADKQAAAAHADTAPAQYREHEQQVLAQSKADADTETAQGLASMHSSKVGALAKLVSDKNATKSKDEKKRAEVTAKIESIYAATEADVKKILDGIDPKVEAAFDKGEAAARSAFENYVAAKMSAYKKDRYGGWLGGLRWAKDKLLGMPAKVNEFYEAGRELYLKQMDGVISRVADIVGGDLTAAKRRIAAGKAEITSYVKSLPASLKKIGAAASREIGERFAQLEKDVDSKQESLVDTLATKYVEARKGLDERIEALQAENRGLVDKAIGAIKAVINTIRELAAMLRNVLARVAGVVGSIIKNPVGFLKNLIAGIKGGILKFRDNIVEHLRKGLFSWLFGALAEGGIELPDTFDLKGIVKLLASIFGLTWTNIRKRIVKRIGEKAMAAVEKGVDIFQTIASQGIGGLWQMFVDKLGDIKEMILEKIKDFVVTKIVMAGITWLIGLLNPVGAFIKACKLIYDIVMFFVNNAARIAQFVNTVIDSVADVVRGNISGVVNKINDVLGQMVPIIIGFLASLIGLGGIGAKIREIVETLQKPVNKALDFVINAGLKLAGPIIRGIAGIGSKVKTKVAAGKAWVKGKVAGVKAKIYGGDDSPEGKQRRLEKGVRAGVAAANRLAGRSVGRHVLKPILGGVRVRYGLHVLEPVKQGGFWAVHGVVSRMTEPTKVEVAVDEDQLAEARRVRQTASREWEDTRRALRPLSRKLKDPKSPLGAAEKARGQAAEAAFNALDRTYLTQRDRLNEIQKSKKSQPDELQTLIAFFTSAAEQFRQIRTDIDLAAADPTKIDQEATRLRGEINGQLRRAEAILADPDVVANVVNNPVQADLVARINTRLTVVKDGLAAITAPVTDLPTLERLRTIKEAANGLQSDTVEAGRIKDLAVQVRAQVDAIDAIIFETTKAGRPGATEGDGSSEAAVAKEVATGQQTGDRWHGIKCADEARGLDNAIATLQRLAGLPAAASYKQQIDDAIQRAEARRVGLRAGEKMWNERAKTHPAIWNEDGTLKQAGTT